MHTNRTVFAGLSIAAVLLLSGCPCGNPAVPVELVALSGPLGYAFDGPYGLSGTILKEYPDDAEWILEGTFEFPNPGYALLAPDIAVAESYPEQVFITLRVLLPSPGGVYPQVITPASFRRSIPASTQATFQAEVQEFCVAPAAGQEPADGDK